MSNELVDIQAAIRSETEKAYLLWDGDRSVWVPKSQTQDNGDGTFTMPVWLAQEKELI